MIDGFKFDLRIYVLVAGCDPMKIFFHKQGLTRFATKPFSRGSSKNKKNRYMHLTNYSVNKLNPKFDKVNIAEAGHKRSL